MCGVLFFASQSLRFALQAGPSATPYWQLNLSFPILMILIGTIGWIQELRLKRVRAVRSSLRENRCPACGYSLTLTRPEEDGCRVCSECGAAWQIVEPERIWNDN
jgi:hypothetical protein